MVVPILLHACIAREWYELEIRWKKAETEAKILSAVLAPGEWFRMSVVGQYRHE